MQNLHVIYEDNHIIVVEKPVNIPSQGDKTGDKDMLTIIKEYIKEKYNKIRIKEFKKTYLVIVNGKFDKNKGILEDYLLKNEKNNMSKVVKEGTKNSKLASLDYEVLKYNEEINLSVLKINLHTGRHHQIRVQLSSRNHSIYGDQKYGGRGHGKQIALWAYKLTIKHPITKEEMEFKCLPKYEGSWKILEDINLQ